MGMGPRQSCHVKLHLSDVRVRISCQYPCVRQCLAYVGQTQPSPLMSMHACAQGRACVQHTELWRVCIIIVTCRDLECQNDYNIGTSSNNVFSFIIHEPTPRPCGHYTAHVVAGLCNRRHFEGCRTGLSNAALHGVLSERLLNDCIKLGKCFLNRGALQSSEQWSSLNQADPLA